MRHRFCARLRGVIRGAVAVLAVIWVAVARGVLTLAILAMTAAAAATAAPPAAIAVGLSVAAIAGFTIGAGLALGAIFARLVARRILGVEIVTVGVVPVVGSRLAFAATVTSSVTPATFAAFTVTTSPTAAPAPAPAAAIVVAAFAGAFAIGAALRFVVTAFVGAIVLPVAGIVAGGRSFTFDVIVAGTRQFRPGGRPIVAARAHALDLAIGSVQLLVGLDDDVEAVALFDL